MSGSNSKVIPREELSAFQRWQFNTLLDVDGALPPNTDDSQNHEPTEDVLVPEDNCIIPDAAAHPSVESLVYPTAEELEAIEHRAQEDGYQVGLAAGKLAAASDVERLRALLSDLSDACKAAESALAEDVVELALVVARQMIRDALHADRTLLLPAIREAIAGLPQVNGAARLMLNPDDLNAVSGLLAGELSADSWRLIPDSSLSSGNCRIEASNATVNLMLAERWSNILQVLGKNNREDLAWDEVPLPAVDAEK